MRHCHRHKELPERAADYMHEFTEVAKKEMPGLMDDKVYAVQQAILAPITDARIAVYGDKYSGCKFQEIRGRHFKRKKTIKVRHYQVNIVHSGIINRFEMEGGAHQASICLPWSP